MSHPPEDHDLVETILRVARGEGSGEEVARVVRLRARSPEDAAMVDEITRLARLAAHAAAPETTPPSARRIVELARERRGPPPG